MGIVRIFGFNSFFYRGLTLQYELHSEVMDDELA